MIFIICGAVGFVGGFFGAREYYIRKEKKNG